MRSGVGRALALCAAVIASGQACNAPDKPAPASPPPAAVSPAPPPVTPVPSPAAEQPAPGATQQAPAAAKPQDPGLAVVREATQEFYRGDLLKLHARFSEELKATFPLDNLAKFRSNVQEKYGKETQLLGEDWQVKGKYRGFVRWARFDKYDGVMQVQWMLHRDDDEVAGLLIEPARKPR